MCSVTHKNMCANQWNVCVWVCVWGGGVLVDVCIYKTRVLRVLYAILDTQEVINMMDGHRIYQLDRSLTSSDFFSSFQNIF